MTVRATAWATAWERHGGEWRHGRGLSAEYRTRALEVAVAQLEISEAALFRRVAEPNPRAVLQRRRFSRSA
jgi:hypothetical protein